MLIFLDLSDPVGRRSRGRVFDFNNLACAVARVTSVALSTLSYYYPIHLITLRALRSTRMCVYIDQLQL